MDHLTVHRLIKALKALEVDVSDGAVVKIKRGEKGNYPCGARAYCDTTGLVACAKDFQNRIGVSGTSAFEGVLTASEFKTRIYSVCSAYDEVFRPCYDRYFDFCPDDNPSSRVIIYLHEMMNYQCHTGKEDVMQHGFCWIKPLVQGQTEACVHRHMGTRAMAQIIRTGNLHRLCHHAYKALTCAGDIVYDHCGKDAAVVYSTLTSYAQLMIAQVASCPNIKNTFGTANNNPYKTENRLPSSTMKPSRRRNGHKHHLSRDRNWLLSAPVTPATVIGRLGGSLHHETENWRRRVTTKPYTWNWQLSSTTRLEMSSYIVGIAVLMFNTIM